MASAGPQPSAHGRKKSLDAEINLVPFIDLLSMCICFLLMTAVWIEIGAVNVKQVVGTEVTEPQTPTTEIDVKFLTPNALNLVIHHPNKTVQNETLSANTTEQLVEQLKTRAKALMLQIMPQAETATRDPKNAPLARLTTKAGVSYGQMISVMDALRENGIVNIGVMPVKE